MTPNQALLSLHADYIGGDNANYRRWYFAAHLDLDDAVGEAGGATKGKRSRKRKNKKKAKKGAEGENDPEQFEDDGSLEAFEERWKMKMNKMSQHQRVQQIALFLLCWGEANQVRFMPELLCFIYKCAWDYFESPECQQNTQPAEEFSYLNDIITPLYQYYRDQGFEIFEGRYVRRERDHSHTIGYDDINQLFWYPEGLERIVMDEKAKERFIDIPAPQRYHKLKDVVWKKTFFKTYRETRSWFHLATNFNRIWILHVTMYWFYVAFNIQPLYTPGYRQQVNDPAPVAFVLTAVGLGGAVAGLIQLIATIAEWAYVPRKWAGAQHLSKRFFLVLLLFIINLAPSVYILFVMPSSTKPDKNGQLFWITKDPFYTPTGPDDHSHWRVNPNYDMTIAKILGIVQFVLAVLTMVYYGVVPLGNIFSSYLRKGKNTRHMASQTFTASWPHLKGNDRYMSWGLWIIVGGIKFGESYAGLVLSLKDPLRFLLNSPVRNCVGDTILGTKLCKLQPQILQAEMIVTDMILFFLDTYIWYVLTNVVFSISRSFYLGVSIWTPWRNIYSRLPKRIYSKVLAVNDMDVKYKPKILISQVWNAIVISMYREHLLDIDHVQKLLYHQVPSEQEGKRTLRAPTFFVAQEDHSFKTDFFPRGGEAERRISFFAQSLSTPIPEPCPIDNMPTFTVMIPHYSEKVLLSLREIIREDEPYSRVTMLEYLKQLHPNEWECFVRDTKNLAEDNAEMQDDKEKAKSKNDDLPFYFLGFKSAAPEYTLRTRIWASLRTQTLYRTISGFMNYARAIKLLYRVENPEVVEMFGAQNTDALEREFERMARRKFKLLVSMQRFSKFSKEEMENAEFLLRAYPDLQVAYLDEEPATEEGGEARIFSALIDGHSEIMENGNRKPKFRIQLSGNPILGDGKSDNQNHAIIFYRGEYIQLVDANQDNYLEECLKIRSVLSEFEEMDLGNVSPYSFDEKHANDAFDPVAILGAREYIFSENIGILGDLAAGKEQTFGTLFARTLAQIGGKLHYGHPDFLNGIFMTTRGGVSKAQKGLHLNEDIYAGMNAMMRGGRIKHCEYFQCGKGRDLGFGSILNFTTKIGTGMGEQMLSREYYYLGTQLPLDRFLSFYYAHPGFHVNNIFIILAVQMLMLCFLNFGALKHETIECGNFESGDPITDPLFPNGCSNTIPINNWVFASCLSIFIVFFLLFIPLTIQDATERGVWRAAQRLAKQFCSFSPLFEIFVCQIYSNSISQNMAFGGARYIATGRGFATARIPFGVLYSRFAASGMYMGARLLLIQLFITCTIWGYWLLYFWVSLLALILAPFVFNPHQFAWADFFIDYRDFLRGLSRGNSRSHASSWIAYVRLSRTKTTGYKRKVIGDPTNQQKVAGDMARAGFTNIFIGEIIAPLLWVILLTIPYLFMNAQVGNTDKNAIPTANLIRVLALGLAPLAVNAGVAGAFFGMACCMGPLFSMCCKKFGAVLAAIAHGFAVIIMIIVFEAMYLLEDWNFSRTLAGLIAVCSIQRFFLKLIINLALTREMKTDSSNIAWWTGKWYNMGWHSLSQPGREFLCKITELTMFAGDFWLGHVVLFLQAPIILMPYSDKLHSMMLFWLKPSKQIRPPIYSIKQSKLRARRVVRYAILYFFLLIVWLALIIAPAVVPGIPLAKSILAPKTGYFPLKSINLIQPTRGIYNDTVPTLITGSNIKPGLSAKTTDVGDSPGGDAATTGAANPTSAAARRRAETFAREELWAPQVTMMMVY